MSREQHIPVLLQEVLDGLSLSSNANCIDGTVGAGGHAREILKHTAPGGIVIGFDRDKATLENTTATLQQEGFGQRFIPVHDSYRTLQEHPEVTNRDIHGILVDLGLSSMQLDSPHRGFAFRLEGPLDMRFDQTSGITAAELLQSQPEEELRRIFREYGEEPAASRIARAIVQDREIEPITTTEQLRTLVESVLKHKAHHKTHPATRVFQALRIAVNEELNQLIDFLPSAVQCLSTGGRIAIITFHSIEDRIVKHYLKDAAKDCVCPPELPECRCDHRATLKIITRKPIMPSEEEIAANPRARSAKLRIAEKL